jgi:hypothetical protein
MKIIVGILRFFLMMFSMMIGCIMMVVVRSFGMPFLLMVVWHHAMGEHNSIRCNKPEQYEKPIYQTGAKV